MLICICSHFVSKMWGWIWKLWSTSKTQYWAWISSFASETRGWIWASCFAFQNLVWVWDPYFAPKTWHWGWALHFASKTRDCVWAPCSARALLLLWHLLEKALYMRSFLNWSPSSFCWMIWWETCILENGCFQPREWEILTILPTWTSRAWLSRILWNTFMWISAFFGTRSITRG